MGLNLRRDATVGLIETSFDGMSVIARVTPMEVLAELSIASIEVRDNYVAHRWEQDGVEGDTKMRHLVASEYDGPAEG